MKRIYEFYDKEQSKPVKITYDFPLPFIENLDNHLKEIYGADLTFVKEINHLNKIIRIHTAYDSGKGTKYIEAIYKPNRISISIKYSQILNIIYSDILELKDNSKNENLVILFLNNKKECVVYRDASIDYDKLIIGGYFVTRMYTYNLYIYLLRKKYYPNSYYYII